MSTNLPVPFSDRSLVRADRANLVEQYRAASRGEIAAINERFERGDTARRIANGLDLYDHIADRTTELHRRIASARDDDLRDMLMAGLVGVFGAAVSRTASYIRGS